MRFLATLLAVTFCTSSLFAAEPLRPPSVPLVACDPYFSLWSPADRLTDSNTTHWTGRTQRLFSQLSVDGELYRLMGDEPREMAAAKQLGVQVLPTRTIYEFEAGKVKVQLTFTTPALPDDLDLLSWPVTYLTYTCQSTDGKPHQVQVTFEAGAELAVNEADQPTQWQTPTIPGLSVQSVGSESQAVLNRSGDDLRIDWGYLYVASPEAAKPTWNEHRMTIDFGAVDSGVTTRWLMLAYDDLYSIQYMKENLRPYWRRNGWEASDLLQAANARYSDLMERCQRFDDELLSDLREAGGEEYAQLCSLCYRQCFAAGKFVADSNGQPLQFSKENHSNGCIATSDVFYPMAPQFLLFGPSLAKSFVVPFMNYAASDRWKFPFAPHDLGQYPLANGQVYGGGERSEENQMPVEESGNLLLIMAAIAQMEGNADFAGLYWKQIKSWAEYLKDKGFDPDNQLCTDDFAGHMAHNVNLSAKAICAIGAYAKLCEMRGETAEAQQSMQLARQFAHRWVESADNGDHYRLAFDREGSWSQKYNLIWDQILGLNLFPKTVVTKEMAFYRKMQNQYGLPLDNRESYTKLDWILWTATLTQNREDFEALLHPVIEFINETPDRAPLTDWYQTKSARKVGFTARPVVGGVFAQMLYDQAKWNKWAKRDQTKAANWAPMPVPPVVTEVVKTAPSEPSTWHYTTTQPAGSWFAAGFDPSGWKQGQSGFGVEDTPGASVGTQWNAADIWMVRDIELEGADVESLNWLLHHDEEVELYLNGELVAKFGGFTVGYETYPLTAKAKAALKPGANRLAVHCHQTRGGQYIDVGLAMVKKAKP